MIFYLFIITFFVFAFFFCCVCLSQRFCVLANVISMYQAWPVGSEMWANANIFDKKLCQEFFSLPLFLSLFLFDVDGKFCRRSIWRNRNMVYNSLTLSRFVPLWLFAFNERNPNLWIGKNHIVLSVEPDQYTLDISVRLFVLRVNGRWSSLSDKYWMPSAQWNVYTRCCPLPTAHTLTSWHSYTHTHILESLEAI